jgi:hypothetical protein
MSRLAIAIVVTALLGDFTTTQAAPVRNIFDARVPMRDEIELSADIWLPEKPGKYPAILVRTPYTQSAAMFVPIQKRLVDQGYVVVFGFVRGRGDSDGAFLGGGEGSDGYDTIEWIARQPWSNGDVCMMGLSYLGGVQWAAARLSPSPLRCMVPTASAATLINGAMYVGGAFSMEQIQWFNRMSGNWDKAGVTTGLDWERIFQHRPLLSLDEAMGRIMPLYRKVLTMRDPGYDIITEKRFGVMDFENINSPALHITGWFDGALAGAMEFWDGMAAHSPAKERQHLLIGPWDHGQTFFGGKTSTGEMEFSKDSIVDVAALHARFFNHVLKGEGTSFDFPRARIYVTGANHWRDLDTYPPTQSHDQRFHLHSGGNANTAGGDGLLGRSAPGSEPTDSFVYDPKKPVPSGGGAGLGADQRPIEQRRDVLVYTGEVLSEPLEIIGRVSVELYAASDARDTDFAARLIDVYPDSRAVRLGSPVSAIVRARYRNGFGKEELLTPGKIEKYTILLRDVGHTFLAGHRLRLEVTSSAFPLVNPNQNTGNPIATDTEWRIAKQTIYHDQDHPSALILPVFLKSHLKAVPQ